MTKLQVKHGIANGTIPSAISDTSATDHCLDLAEVFFGLAYALLGFAVIEGCLAFFSK